MMELARFMGSETVMELERAMHRLSLNSTLSIDRPIGEDGRCTLADFLVGPPGPLGHEDDVGSEGDHDLLLDHLRTTIDDSLRSLKAIERTVLIRRFGLRDGEPTTLKEIAKDLGKSPERVRQIEALGIRKLRHPSRSKPLKIFLE
jgi:RNA polymerase primary sigma factor